jgi:hypothetical protein
MTQAITDMSAAVLVCGKLIDGMEDLSIAAKLDFVMKDGIVYRDLARGFDAPPTATNRRKAS